jgi:hypothetical protein
VTLSRFRQSAKALVVKHATDTNWFSLQTDLLNVVLDMIDVYDQEHRMMHYDRIIDELLDFREQFKSLIPPKEGD